MGGKKVVHANAQASARLQQIQGKTARRSGGSRGRVVVKANYIQVGKGNSGGRASAFASANYMMFRPSEDGEFRKGFDGERHLEPHEVHQRVGEHSEAHKYAYRMVMSSDRNFGEKTTEEWASNTLKKLGYDTYIVISHAGDKGHTQHPHAHVLVFTDARLGRPDFQTLRDFGDVQAKEIEMRLRFDRHMEQYQWREQKEDEFKQWKVNRELKTQIKSEGVDDLAQKEKRDRHTRQEKQISTQQGMEM